MTHPVREVIVSRRQLLTASRWSALLALLLFGACLYGPTPAFAQQTDSTYTADTTAIVAGLWPGKVKGPGKTWFLAGATAVVAGAAMRDGGGYRDRDQPFSNENLLHLTIAAGIGTVTASPRGACVLAALYDVGQMRPSGFPAAHRGQRLGKFSALDVGLACAGAYAMRPLTSAWQRVSR